MDKNMPKTPTAWDDLPDEVKDKEVFALPDDMTDEEIKAYMAAIAQGIPLDEVDIL